MAEFKVIETQEQFDAAIGDRLKREGDKIRKEYEGFLSPDEAKKQYEGWLSPEAEKEKYKKHLSPEDAAKKDAKLKEYETNSVKMRIAHETGLSYEAVDYLKGEDEEAIRKSAETLKKMFGAGNVAPLASSEEPLENEKKTALKNTLRGLKGE